jgi:hypothetical protein
MQQRGDVMEREVDQCGALSRHDGRRCGRRALSGGFCRQHARAITGAVAGEIVTAGGELVVSRDEILKGLSYTKPADLRIMLDRIAQGVISRALDPVEAAVLEKMVRTSASMKGGDNRKRAVVRFETASTRRDAERIASMHYVDDEGATL